MVDRTDRPTRQGAAGLGSKMVRMLSGTLDRKKLMKAKGATGRDHRREGFRTENDFEGTEVQAPVTPQTQKSDEVKAALIEALHDHFLFQTLEPQDLIQVVDSMLKVEADEGASVITQGDMGSDFLVLYAGTCDIVVDGERIGEYTAPACFGELALMYSARRAATIRATSTSVLYSLGLKTFRRILATTSSARMMARCEFLRRVPLLQPLTNEQITKVAGALAEVELPERSYVITQGDFGDTFYIIEEGRVKCTHRKSDVDGTEADLITLGPGDYFGEMALMLDEPRHANVIALTPLKCLTLDRNQFIELLGPLSEVLSRQMRIRILRSVPLLANLADEELDTIANAMRVQVFEDREYIIRQGEDGTRFYIINEGEVMCTLNDAAAKGGERELIRLSSQEYFGERALLKGEPRGANVIALGRVECLVLEREDFESFLGDLTHHMEREVRRREEIGKQRVEAEVTRTERPRERRVMDSTITFDELRQIRTIGTGTFGRVKLVQHRPTGRVLALKCMQKAQIVSSHQERNIMNEKAILSECIHPFILELVQTFNSPNQLFMLMECVQGGELWSYIYEKFDTIPRTSIGGFVIDTSRFYSSCVISAFLYVHSLGVAYRDLKPENLLIDHEGFLKIIDFGFAKKIPFKKSNSVQTKSFTLCGTPEYLAPELVLSKGHDKSVDYWALGCLIYELIVGRTPFQDDHQPEIFKKIIHSERALSFPRGFDSTAADLVRRLLTPNPAFRLGNLNGGVREIMGHRWFTSVDYSWAALEGKALRPPYIPQIRDPLDTSNFDPYPEDDYVPRYAGPQHIFDGF